MFSGLKNRVMKVGASMGVVKTGEQDEGAKQRVAALQKATANLRAALGRYFKAFSDRGAATAAVHESMEQLYPPGQPFSANLEALATRTALWKDVKATLDAMKDEIEGGLSGVDAKLATVLKMVQERAALRIDIGTHSSDVATHEAAGAKGAAKLEVSKAKLAECQERFNTVESVVLPELDRLDHEIAALTTGPFQNFINAQVQYNQHVLDAYYAGLSAIPASTHAATEEGLAAPTTEEAPIGAGAGEEAVVAATTETTEVAATTETAETAATTTIAAEDAGVAAVTEAIADVAITEPAAPVVAATEEAPAAPVAATEEAPAAPAAEAAVEAAPAAVAAAE